MSKPPSPDREERGKNGERSAMPEPEWGRDLRRQPYDGWPMELVNAEGRFCGCLLYPSGNLWVDLLAIAEHAAPGNCPSVSTGST